MSNQPQSSHRVLLWFVVVMSATLFGFLYFALLPRSVIVYNDDFGYLRSVLETAARGQPWTDDWLEPWAASLSVLSALVWKITGSFRWAIHGVQAFVVALGFVGAILTLIKRGYSLWVALLVTVVVFTTPTVLWKDLEYTGFFLSLTCLLAAAFSAEHRSWLAFTFFTGIAIANRQSAIAWLALPAFEVVRSFWHRGACQGLRTCRNPFCAVVAGCVCYLAVGKGMNRTHSQEVMTTAMWEAIQPATVGRWFLVACIIVFLMVGLANLTRWLSAADRDHRTKGRRLIDLFVSGGTTFVLYIIGRNLGVQFEHSLLSSSSGQLYEKLVLVLAAVGWSLQPPKIDWSLLVGAAACALLASLRSAVWDYYFVDTALLALLAAFPDISQRGSAALSSPPLELAQPQRLLRHYLAAPMVIGTLLWFQFDFAREAKRTLDNFHAVSFLLEQSLREGKITADEISLAPFGFRGWHLYPYFIGHEGAGRIYIANFEGYIKLERLVLQTCASNDPRPLEQQERIVAQGIFKIGWKEQHRFVVRRQEGQPPALALDTTQFKIEPYPMTDEEWQALLDKTRLIRHR